MHCLYVFIFISAHFFVPYHQLEHNFFYISVQIINYHMIRDRTILARCWWLLFSFWFYSFVCVCVRASARYCCCVDFDFANLHEATMLFGSFFYIEFFFHFFFIVSFGRTKMKKNDREWSSTKGWKNRRKDPSEVSMG